MTNIKLALTFYIIRNKEGKFYRPRGHGGYGPMWVDEIQKAKVYQKLNQAQSRVTFWGSEFPQYGVPDIIAIYATTGVVLDEAQRVAKAVATKEKRKATALLKHKKIMKEHAEYELKRAQDRLKQMEVKEWAMKTK